MSSPLVSVITPAYNAEQYIAETIQSVIDQTYPHWEMLIVDDGSTDKTADVVARFDDPRVKLIPIEHSGLPAVARNRGIEAASGEYIAFLDADDVWYPRKLERQIKKFKAVPEAGLVHCRPEKLVDNTRVPWPSRAIQYDFLFHELVKGNFICNSSVVVRRSVLEEHGLFDTDPRLKGTEDYELWLRLAIPTKFASVEEPLLLYRVHPDGISKNEVEIAIGELTAVEKNRARYPHLFAELGTVGKQRLTSLHRTLGILLCIDGMSDHGRRELLTTIRLRPSDLLSWKWILISFLGSSNIRKLRYLKQVVSSVAR